VLQCVTRSLCSVLKCVEVCCSVLQCVAVCCSVLQCVVMCCSVLQCADAARWSLQCSPYCHTFMCVCLYIQIHVCIECEYTCVCADAAGIR